MTGDSRPCITLVVPGIAEGGGVSVVAQFLHRVITESGRYRAEVLSLATSSRDRESVRLSAPASWLGAVRTRRGSWDGLEFLHVGALGAELEFQRYRPRRILTRLLDDCDLVQVVAGAPSWALVARDLRVPVGLQVATLTPVERRERLATERGLRGAWTRWMTRIASRIDHAGLRVADAIFVENAWMRETARKIAPRAEVIFAPPGVDTDRFTPSPDGPDTTDPYILSVGRMDDPRKRIGLLLRAYAEMRRDLARPPRLVLAGSRGPRPEDLHLAARLGIERSVEVREQVPLDELSRLYRRASLYVLSSDEEGLGLVILEAMASGVPVVSTDCGGPSTSVVEGVTGRLVPRGDAAALASAMRSVYSNGEQAREMGRQARRRAESSFSLWATGGLFLDWYDRTLGARAHARVSR